MCFILSIHDSTTIVDSLNALNNKFNFKDKRYHSTLIADKGYIIDKEKKNNLINNFKTKLFTPSRRKSEKQKKKENKKNEKNKKQSKK